MLFFFLMIRRPPRSTLDRSSAASDVYKRQVVHEFAHAFNAEIESVSDFSPYNDLEVALSEGGACLLYTSPSPRDRTRSRMPSSV